jgi:hypothetical protein
MTKPLPPETLAWLYQSAAVEGAAYSHVLLHLLERVEALERKYETQRLATLEWGKDVDKLMRWIDDHLKRIMALEAAQQQPHANHFPGATKMVTTPEAAPVVTDEELCRVYNDGSEHGFGPAIRACYDLGRQHGAAQPPAAPPVPLVAPAGGLVCHDCRHWRGGADPCSQGVPERRGRLPIFAPDCDFYEPRAR